ncbi:hypothetical protein AWB75_00758 [Caballeronia catudaia]|uniref:Transposase n=1 Tax=Caballeronia catudaia TaxID=1777136 RepID=A0A157ZIB0_9BURK|nr:hypothetical protein AWB75_00758 [Caballeronia catudaia]
MNKFSGIDLHSNNSVVVVSDDADRVVYQRRLPNDPVQIRAAQITRHVKVRGPANPFDRAWTSYFARRRAAKHPVSLSGATPWC